LQASARLPGQDTLEAMLDLYGMADLAGTVYAQGDLPGARKLEEQVLEARERLLGKEHPDTLMAMNNLAVTLYAQGELAGARKLQKQVLEGRRRLLGKEHPDTLPVGTLKRTGRFRIGQQFLEIMRALFPPSAKFRSKKTP
jgi:hypothetical protein